MTIDPARIDILNDRPHRQGGYVLYWMQQSQRARCNHALEHAVHLANTAGLPLLVCFVLTADYPEANLRHYTFMLEGLQETERALASRGIRLVVLQGDPVQGVLGLASRASSLVCDRGYLRHQRVWRRETARKTTCPMSQVESDVVVPVEVASTRREFAARTIRRKIQSRVDEFLDLPREEELERTSLDLTHPSLSLDDIPALCRRIGVDSSVPPVSRYFHGGTARAEERFRRFLDERFNRYAENRNQPQTDDVSHMSPYLHFGQISPLWLAQEARKHREVGLENRESFLEELLVRRELAVNFVYFTPEYDAYSALPEWARRTLSDHRDDKRSSRYASGELDNGATHDPYWNAAMAEMKVTGYMHNAMRMYWGKKILEWSDSPEEAFRNALSLNNKYFLDGRDPSSYANVGWIFGLHDRPFRERPIFGKVRYMNAKGLERKSDIGAYVRKVERMSEIGTDTGKAR
jgi:deoxyribodipyrimidine photo-lyase